MSGQYAEARRRMNHPTEETVAQASHCGANNCTLAPAITHNAGKSWFCAYHAGASIHDLHSINTTLQAHPALVDTINAGRRLLSTTAPATDWATLRENLDRLGYQVPAPRGIGDSFGAWLYRVETLLGELVASARVNGQAAS